MSDATTSGYGRILGLIAWVGLAIGVLSTLLAVVAGFGYRFEMIGLGDALGTYFQWGVKGALAGLGIFLLASIINQMRSIALVWLAVPATVVVVGFGYLVVPQIMTARSVPPIHDITTDTEYPPEFVDAAPLRDAQCAAGRGCNGNEYVREPDYLGGRGVTVPQLQKYAYGDIKPAYFDEDQDAVYARALAAVDAMGWKLIGQSPANGRIEASHTSFWFGFTDDIVIRVEPEGTRTRLDIRSKSRVGRSDVGANAARIRKFLAKMTPDA